MSFSCQDPAWFRRHFNEDYRLLYPGRDLAQAEVEVDGLVHQLVIGQADAVLDLCCGFGRHLRAFARRGIAAVGVDISASLLRQVDRSIAPRLVCADMRALPFGRDSGAFSVVVNFFTSFGYFDSDADNERAAQELARVLRPAGRFALDLMNPAPTICRLVPRTERHVEGCRVLEQRRHDPVRRRIEKRIEVLPLGTGETRVYHESVRIYAPAEIDELLRGAGLHVERWLGDFAGTPLTDSSPRMIVLGRKPA